MRISEDKVSTPDWMQEVDEVLKIQTFDFDF